uniref:Putative secreted protein n=1 Tax=Ixodes ricinus TaxID=34613 RepID=V5HTY5_IXORI
MLLAIVVGVLVIWKAFVVPEPLVTYPPGDIRNNRSELILKFLMDSSNYPRRNRSDPSTRVHQHSGTCPRLVLLSTITFYAKGQASPLVDDYSPEFCERKPPAIPQPVMGTFGLRPRKCAVCCVTRNGTNSHYTVKNIWPGAPCSERMVTLQTYVYGNQYRRDGAPPQCPCKTSVLEVQCKRRVPECGFE